MTLHGAEISASTRNEERATNTGRRSEQKAALPERARNEERALLLGGKNRSCSARACKG